MAEEKIEFRKVRDFGEIINDTFLFIRQNFKQLITAFFAICGIFLLVQAVFSSLYMSSMLGILTQARSGGTDYPRMSDIFTGQYFYLWLFVWLSFTAMKVTIASYIKYYTENDGARPGIEEIWVYFKRYYVKVFTYSTLIVLLIFFGLGFCLVPGIYLAIVFTPFELILIVEDASFGDAWVRCFRIVKDHFWKSFAVYLVAAIIYWISSGIISSLISLFSGVTNVFTTSDISREETMVASFLNIFSSVFFIIFYIAAALNYFSLVEQKEGTGIMSRINRIGDHKKDVDNIDEQY